MTISLKNINSYINIQNTVMYIIILFISIILIYILIHIFRKKKCLVENKKVPSKNVANKKCENDICLDKYNVNKCSCGKNHEEAFTMVQSVFPLHAPTIPAYSQMLNENMVTISDNYMENVGSDPLTRKHPSLETTTGLFNVIPIKSSSSSSS